MFFIRRSKKLAASEPVLTTPQVLSAMVELTEAQERELWEMEQDRRARQRRARARDEAALDESARAERLRRAENIRRESRLTV